MIADLKGRIKNIFELLQGLYPRTNGYKPEVLALVAECYDAMVLVAARSMDAASGSQTSAYRYLQFGAQKKYHFPEWVELPFTGDLGQRMWVASAQIIAAKAGYELVPVGEVPVIGTREAHAALTLSSAELEASVTLGRPEEEIRARAQAVISNVRTLIGPIVNAKREFYRRKEAAGASR